MIIIYKKQNDCLEIKGVGVTVPTTKHLPDRKLNTDQSSADIEIGEFKMNDINPRGCIEKEEAENDLRVIEEVFQE